MDERVDPATSRVEKPLASPDAATRRRFPLFLLLLLVVAAGGGGWYWWSHRAGTRPAGRAAQSAAQPVGVAVVGTGDIRIVLNALGTVTPLATVTVKTQISGQLQQVAFQEGQQVKKGDFLAQVDPRPYQNALNQAIGTLAHDQGLLDQAQIDLKRYQTLSRQDSIAQQQVDDQRFIVAQYAGTVQADQALADAARLNLAYCHIVSPVDGQTGLRQVDAGNYVQTSDANGLVVITQMAPISVIFAVAEDSLPAITAQLRAGAKLQVQAYDRANLTLLATGQLATLDNQIDTTTGTLKLRAAFANDDGKLYPNQFVNARLLVSTLANAVRIPQSAVQRGAPGTFAYVVKDDSTVTVRPIVLGPSDGGFVAVTSGLTAGERVVSDGTDRLREGAAVVIPPPAAAAPTPAPAARGPRPAGQARPATKP